MKTSLCISLAILLSFSTLDAGQKTGEIKGWGKIADPEGDCEFLEKAGKLTIKVPGTYHDFTPFEPYKNNGPRVYKEVEGDFTIEVKVSGKILARPGSELPGRDVSFRAGCLLIWQDHKNFVRFDRASMWKGNQSQAFAYFHVFKDGTRPVELGPFVKDEPTVLRIERKGDKIRASAKQGSKVTYIPQETVTLPARVQVCVGAINASTEPFEVHFEDLRIMK